MLCPNFSSQKDSAARMCKSFMCTECTYEWCTEVIGFLPHVPWSINSHDMDPYNRGWETQPKSGTGFIGPHYKDSVIKGGMTISNIATFDHGTHDSPRQFDLSGMLHARRARRSRQTSLVCVAQRLDLCKGICHSSDNQMFKSESYVSTCLNQQLFCSSYFKKICYHVFLSLTFPHLFLSH